MTAPTTTTQENPARTPVLPVEKPFHEWTREDARMVLRSEVANGPTETGYERSRSYIMDRDHWQKGAEWKGPRGTDATSAAVLARVEPQHIPVDVLNEVLDTAADALLERHPDLSFGLRVPPADPASTEGKAAIDKAKEDAAPIIRALNAWAKKRKLVQTIRKAYKFSRWSTWGTLRAWVPPAKLDRVVADDGEEPEAVDEGEAPPISFAFKSGLTLEEALDTVYVTAPEPECCVVYEDPESRDRVAIFSYRYQDEDTVELWWVDSDGQTHVKTMTSKSGDVEQTIDLLGWLPITQVDSELLITDSVRRQQARLNFFESLIVRVGEQSGFPERYTINAKATGIWMLSAPSDGPALEVVEQDGHTWFLHPGVRTLGSAITTDLVGITTVDPTTGKDTVATPNVMRFEPTDPDFAIRSASHARQTIRSECKQGHVEMDGEATATGWSRVQARARFISDMANHVEPLSLLICDAFEAALGYARQMTTELAGFCEAQQAQVTVRVSPGPVSPEERAAILEQVAAGLMAPETAMVMLGVDDVPAELERIRQSPEGQAARLEKQFALLQLAIAAGLSLTVAAEIVGFDDEHLAIIKRDQARVLLTEGPTQGSPQDAAPPAPGRENTPPAPPSSSGSARPAAKAA